MASVVWNRRLAAHLYRRAGFGGTPEELDRAVAEGLEATVERLIHPELVPNDALDQRLAALPIDLTKFPGIIRWWLTRMIFSARPLEERMTLFLHDHFATSFAKVSDPGAMLQQNELFRRFALGRFDELTIEVARDPAMLRWLDNFLSRKDNPNENFGRELLELFLLGHGNYSEDDVMAATRAFTGWTLSRQTRQFVFVDAFHDHGLKTFLGQVGDWNGDDVVKIACAQAAHGEFLARKLFEWFAYAGPDHGTVERLANAYRSGGNSLRDLVRAILTDPEMYSERAVWTKVKMPLDFVVSAARHLALTSDPTRLAGAYLPALGQIPFYPPDVDGWPEGLTWINSGALLNRMNYANGAAGMADPATLGPAPGQSSAAELVTRLLGILGEVEVSAHTRMLLERYVAPDGALPSGFELRVKGRGLAHLILSLPEWQMN